MSHLPAATAEATEAEAMFRYETGAPPDDQKFLGIAAHRFSGGVVLSAPNDPTGLWNKAIGIGFDEPITGDLVDRILDLYHAEGNPRATLAFAPEVLPDDWAEIMATRGLRPGTAIVKLAARAGDLDPGLPAGSGLRIAPVAADAAMAWADAVRTGFGRPAEGFTGMFAATAGRPEFHPYAAWSGDRVVGGGNLFVHGAVGELIGGAVLPEARRRGAQTALIAARIARARELGCEWIITECVQPAEGASNPSLNNMLRAGFKPLYVRQEVQKR
ncbi:GNAT family N-acetyltransferase [Actinoplanes sp. NPDC049265]|uniref:GNAT family N-acetyltransferase n=1 Tax=Actinoplanes sp. NPDC049265 TaxID=3363902 RepID=UPI003723E307